MHHSSAHELTLLMVSCMTRVAVKVRLAEVHAARSSACREFVTLGGRVLTMSFTYRNEDSNRYIVELSDAHHTKSERNSITYKKGWKPPNRLSVVSWLNTSSTLTSVISNWERERERTTHYSLRNKTAHKSRINRTLQVCSFSLRDRLSKSLRLLSCHCLDLPLLFTFSNKQQSTVMKMQLLR